MPRRADEKLRERIEEIAREIGTLLVAFAPLDAVLGTSVTRLKGMLIFWALGILFIAGALVSEHRRENVE